jgi:hypothetical protein
VWAWAGADRRGPPVRGGGRAWGARPVGLVCGLGRNEVFHFPGISNAFSILFSLGFSIQIQTKSNMSTNLKNILDST